jgi:hypothetical protein
MLTNAPTTTRRSTARTASEAGGWTPCGPKCAELGGEALQDFLSPQGIGPTYYGGHVVHGLGAIGEGTLFNDPLGAASGAFETGKEAAR